jgi:catechol 2,3-dioxygenase-like lactoylglutathione lyase family enzyme
MSLTTIDVISKDPIAPPELGPDFDVRVIQVGGSANGPSALPAAALRAIMNRGATAFPLTLVDGELVAQGRLPSEQELTSYRKSAELEPQFTKVAGYIEDSSVKFPTRSRVHMNLIVKDVERAVKFYQVFLGQPPIKNTGDYAKFELHDPPINLALMVDPHGGAHQHFGIQVKSTAVIREAVSRYDDAGFFTYAEEGAACCYAKQEKTWVVDPDGNQWEVFVTTDTDSQEGCAPDCICYQTLTPSGVN